MGYIIVMYTPCTGTSEMDHYGIYNCYVRLLYSAIQVFGIVRHGARYPTVSHIRKWNTLLSRLHAHPSTPTTALANELMEWVNPFNLSHAAHMTNHGLLEQYCLGQRFLTR